MWIVLNYFTFTDLIADILEVENLKLFIYASQPGRGGVMPGYPSSPMGGNPTPPMTPGTTMPSYLSPGQDNKPPYLSPDTKPNITPQQVSTGNNNSSDTHKHVY